MRRLLAALSFFTRLPFWRILPLRREDYERVVPLWPVAGVLTGGVMALVYGLASLLLPTGVCLVLAVAARILLTGALHEDGFADFCDGFGGGTSRERTLEIMKDSHIGTYGVLGLIFHALLLWNVLSALAASLPAWQMCCALLFVDVWSKWMGSTIVSFLPYARKEAEAKNRLVYATEARPYLTLLLSVVSLNAPVLFLLFRWMKHRIGGYTGDCCGATFVILEMYNYLLLLLLCSIL